jgi:ActR/RegA family two-component response regulator
MVYTQSLLILTDEPIFSFGLRVQLQKWGFTWVDIIETCQLAIQSIRKQVPVLMVLDEKFIEGQALSHHLILLTELQAIPLILLTTNQDLIRYKKESGEKNNNYIYLSKPCQISDLKVAVETLLHISKLPA